MNNETSIDAARTKCPEPDKMSDQQLVNYVGRRFTKFLLDMRPYLIEVHSRFIQKKATRRPLLGYRDWDRFCLDFFQYTGRHVRRIISGEALPKPPKKSLSASAPAVSSGAALPNTAVWTDHDFIHKGAQAIKQLLHPLESDPARYAKVAHAIADEITGEAAIPKSASNETTQASTEHQVLHWKGEGAQ